MDRALISLSAIIALPLLTTSCAPRMIQYQGHTVFNPVYTFYLESPARDQWQMPDRVLDAMGLSEGSIVADIGAGGGYFTEKFSHRVGASGHVYATDVQEVMLRKLHQRVKKQSLANVTVIRGDFDQPNLPPGTCDWLFFSSVYKEVDNRVAYMRTASHGLKKGARVAVIEYRMDTRAPGPPRKHRISEQEVIREMGAAGFHLQDQFDFLPREYFLVFSRHE